jgi:hypothetical protein
MKYRSKDNQKGHALTEMALTLPILLLLVMGIMDFGRMVFLYAQVANAAREGARYGSVVGLDTLQQFRDCEQIRETVLGIQGLPVTPDLIDIRYDDGATALPYDCNGTTGIPAEQISPGDRILVRVDATFQFLTPGVSVFLSETQVSFTAARTILLGGTLVPPDE